MTYHKQDDWLPLTGETVQIRINGRAVRTGLVDAVTTDNQILWLASDGVHQRRMISKADGYEVWMTYKWESPPTFGRQRRRSDAWAPANARITACDETRGEKCEQ